MVVECDGEIRKVHCPGSTNEAAATLEMLVLYSHAVESI